MSLGKGQIRALVVTHIDLIPPRRLGVTMSFTLSAIACLSLNQPAVIIVGGRQQGQNETFEVMETGCPLVLFSRPVQSLEQNCHQ